MEAKEANLIHNSEREREREKGRAALVKARPDFNARAFAEQLLILRLTFGTPPKSLNAFKYHAANCERPRDGRR